MFFIFFFFFQAEDGIRDRNVTSSDVCSSDLGEKQRPAPIVVLGGGERRVAGEGKDGLESQGAVRQARRGDLAARGDHGAVERRADGAFRAAGKRTRPEQLSGLLREGCQTRRAAAVRAEQDDATGEGRK